MKISLIISFIAVINCEFAAADGKSTAFSSKPVADMADLFEDIWSAFEPIQPYFEFFSRTLRSIHNVNKLTESSRLDQQENDVLSSLADETGKVLDFWMKLENFEHLAECFMKSMRRTLRQDSAETEKSSACAKVDSADLKVFSEELIKGIRIYKTKYAGMIDTFHHAAEAELYHAKDSSEEAEALQTIVDATQLFMETSEAIIAYVTKFNKT